jgi:cytochrome c oxidase subunit 3
MSSLRGHGVIALRNQRTAETLWIAFAATVVMLFAGFTAAYMIRRTASDFERVALPSLVYANTALLLTSSWTVERARRGAGRTWSTVTLAIGIAFLVGQTIAWMQLADAGVLPSTSPQGAFFVLLSAVHGVHLLGGLVAPFMCARGARPPRLAAAYWHFVGLVWIYVLVLLHLELA